MMISLIQLQYILAVYREKHFGKAAGVCHVSQPSLSFQIQKAEETLGFVLFDRSSKPVKPTDQGQIFIEQAENVMDEYQALMTIQPEKRLSGPFNVGVIPTLSPYLIPLMISDFSTQYPHVQLTLTESKTETLLDLLDTQKIDAAVLATEVLNPKFDQQLFWKDDFYIFTSEPQRFSGSEIEPKMLSGVPMWLLGEGHCFKDQIIDVCSLQSRNTVMPTVSFSGGNLETLIHLIKRGSGTTILPHLAVRFLSDSDKKKYLIPFADPVPGRMLSLVTRKKSLKRPIAGAFLKLCKKACSTF